MTNLNLGVSGLQSSQLKHAFKPAETLSNDRTSLLDTLTRYGSQRFLSDRLEALQPELDELLSYPLDHFAISDFSEEHSISSSQKQVGCLFSALGVSMLLLSVLLKKLGLPPDQVEQAVVKYFFPVATIAIAFGSSVRSWNDNMVAQNYKAFTGRASVVLEITEHLFSTLPEGENALNIPFVAETMKKQELLLKKIKKHGLEAQLNPPPQNEAPKSLELTRG